MAENSITPINKENLIKLLSEFAYSKPGFDLADYGELKYYKQDYRAYKKDADYNRSYINSLEWILAELSDDDIYNCFRAFSGRLSFDGNKLEYCAGQYYPTEYQAALRAVFDSMSFHYNKNTAQKNPPEPIAEYSSISEIKAQNKAKGGTWFAPKEIRFFGTKIHGGVIQGKYFITSEQRPQCHVTKYPLVITQGARQFSIREAKPNGDINTVGDFGQFSSLQGARDYLKEFTGGKS